MADSMYDRARQKFLGGELDWDTQTFKARLVSSSYTYNAAHTSVNDLAGVIHTSAALSSPTKTNGFADAADITFTAVTAGSTANAMVVYHEDSTSASSTLVVYIDSASAFPITTNGGDIIAVLNASGLFRI